MLPVLFCVIRCSMFGIQCSMYGILWIVFSFAIGTPQIFYNGTIEETSIVCTTDRKAKIMFNNLFGYDIFGVDSTNLHSLIRGKICCKYSERVLYRNARRNCDGLSYIQRR